MTRCHYCAFCTPPCMMVGISSYCVTNYYFVICVPDKKSSSIPPWTIQFNFLPLQCQFNATLSVSLGPSSVLPHVPLHKPVMVVIIKFYIRYFVTFSRQAEASNSVVWPLNMTSFPLPSLRNVEFFQTANHAFILTFPISKMILAEVMDYNNTSHTTIKPQLLHVRNTD